LDIKSISKSLLTYFTNGKRNAPLFMNVYPSTLRSIIELEPHFAKMDRYFGIDLEKSIQKQKLIQRLIEFCGSDITLVLEGLEYQSDLDIAKELGVHIGQGYLLGRPSLLDNVV
jgi:EAL domain-containing protein (putative c-di-GMP-specific phosphodiesterase class I)